MRIRLLLLAAAVLAAGCASYDPETVYTLNKRLTELEGGRVSARQPDQPRQLDSLNYVDIYVPLDNSSYYPVRIRQVGPNAFKGPKGELYYSFPTVDQLRRCYDPRYYDRK